MYQTTLADMNCDIGLNVDEMGSVEGVIIVDGKLDEPCAVM